MRRRREGVHHGRSNGVREMLFRSATKLFALRGYFATTIRDIVEDADVTQPMVYYYFGSKEELFVTCIKETYRKLTELYKTIDPHQPFRRFITQVIEKTFEFFLKCPEDLLLLVNYIHSSDEYPSFEGVEEVILEPLYVIIRGVEEGKKRSEVRRNVDPVAFGVALFGAFGLAASFLYKSDKLPLPRKPKAKDFSNLYSQLFTQGVEERG